MFIFPPAARSCFCLFLSSAIYPLHFYFFRCCEYVVAPVLFSGVCCGRSLVCCGILLVCYGAYFCLYCFVDDESFSKME